MCPGPVRVPHLIVKQEEAKQFAAAFSSALRALPLGPANRLYLFPAERKALAISLDADNRPFIGFTAGYNPPNERAYLPRPLSVLERIANLVDARDQPILGGRIFLSEYSASKVIEDREHTLCTYEWPEAGPYSIGISIFISTLVALTGKAQEG